MSLVVEAIGCFALELALTLGVSNPSRDPLRTRSARVYEPTSDWYGKFVGETGGTLIFWESWPTCIKYGLARSNESPKLFLDDMSREVGYANEMRNDSRPCTSFERADALKARDSWGKRCTMCALVGSGRRV